MILVVRARARLQRIVRRPWQALADGCDPCADTVNSLARSGLAVAETHLEPFGSRLDPTNLTYWGTAYRPRGTSPNSR